jgi:imidazolonepropionase-like amidohydrolase
MGLFAAAILAALLLTTLQPQPARADRPPYFAITGAKIVPVSGPPIEGGTVVIANGLIAAVGEDVAIPPEAWVIDGKGLTVYPGLIDAMTNLGQAAAPAARAGGPPSAGPPQPAQQPAQRSQGPEDRPATTPWENAADELNAKDAKFEQWRNAGFTTVVSVPSQGIFPGMGAVVNTAGERAGDLVVKAPATLQIAFASPGGFTGFPGSLMGTLAYIKQVFHDTNHYAQAQPMYEKDPKGKPRADYDRTERAISHALRAGLPVMLPGNNAQQMARAIALADEFKLKAVLYGGQQGYDIADALAAKKYPVLVSLKWPEKQKDADPEADEPLSSLRFRDRAPSTPAALHKAGVKFAFYSDGIAAPADILKSAKKAIDAGLSAEAALRALTLDAAEILGVADRLGSIEPGKIANLIVADGDLFSEKTKLKMVFVDGAKFEVKEPARPAETPAANLTGTWNLTVQTPEGPQQGIATLTMASDGTLTGSVSATPGTASVEKGWVSGNKFSFTITMDLGEGPVPLTFSGTVEGNSMTGTMSLGGDALPLTGTRPGSSGISLADGGAL